MVAGYSTREDPLLSQEKHLWNVSLKIEILKIDGLKREKLKLYCHTAWPVYKLGDGEEWPENGPLNYNTILQLDLYCHRWENGLRLIKSKPSWSFSKTQL